MEIAEHIAAIERDGELMAAAARQSGLDAAVPSCAPWQMRDLLTHQGYVHRWAASYVAGRHLERVPRLSEPELLAAGPADPELLDWFRAGHQALTWTLRAADPGLQCWSFLPAPSPLAFWARRQAHETAMHRADAQQAAGRRVTEFPADFAADGIDELLTGFFGQGTTDGPAGQRALRFTAGDADADWLVTLTGDGSKVARTAPGAPGIAAATVTGPASALYLLLWNRSGAADGELTVEGDTDLLKSWPRAMRVTWG